MPSTKFFNKYHVVCDRENFKLNKKYKSMKDICEDLKDSPLELNSRVSIYNIMNNVGKLYKYHQVKITKIREPLPFKTIVIRELISP